MQLSIIRVPVCNPDELMGPSTGFGWNLQSILVLSPRKIMQQTVKYPKAAKFEEWLSSLETL